MSATALPGATVADLGVTGSARGICGDPVPSRPRSTIRPLRVVRFSDTSLVRVAVGVGFRVVCSCGERGKVRRTVHAARADKRQHDAAHDRGER